LAGFFLKQVYDYGIDMNKALTLVLILAIAGIATLSGFDVVLSNSVDNPCVVSIAQKTICPEDQNFLPQYSSYLNTIKSFTETSTLIFFVFLILALSFLLKGEVLSKVKSLNNSFLDSSSKLKVLNESFLYSALKKIRKWLSHLEFSPSA